MKPVLNPIPQPKRFQGQKKLYIVFLALFADLNFAGIAQLGSLVRHGMPSFFKQAQLSKLNAESTGRVFKITDVDLQSFRMNEAIYYSCSAIGLVALILSLCLSVWLLRYRRAYRGWAYWLILAVVVVYCAWMFQIGWNKELFHYSPDIY